MNNKLIYKMVILLLVITHLIIAWISNTIAIVDEKFIITIIIMVIQCILVTAPAVIIYKYGKGEYKFLVVVTISFILSGFIITMKGNFIFALLPYFLLVIFSLKKVDLKYKMIVIFPLCIFTMFLALKIFFILLNFSETIESEIYLSPNGEDAVVIVLTDNGALGVDKGTYLDMSIFEMFRIRRCLLFGTDQVDVMWISKDKVSINHNIYDVSEQKWVDN